MAKTATRRALPVPALREGMGRSLPSLHGAGSGERSHEEVLYYLRCHGISATSRTIMPQAGSIAETLLSEASDQAAGLLVMGAYSHSRWREMLLGGVTRHVLQNSAVTPVLMAH